MPRLTLTLRPTLGPRRLTLALGAVAQLAAGGCTGPRPVRPGAEPPRATVRVRFAAPRSVAAVAAPGDTLWGLGVAELRGVLVAVRGDTLVLRVRPLPPPADRTPDTHARLVHVVRQPGDRVERRSFAPGRTALLLLGGAAATGVAFVLYGLHVMGHPNY